MTKIQIKKAMAMAGIEGELRGKGKNWEVILDDDHTMLVFQNKVCEVDGRQTGWGGWRLSPSYHDRGDYN